MKAKKNSPDLLNALKVSKPRRGRPPKVKSSPTAAQIADSMEARAKAMLEVAKVLRGR